MDICRKRVREGAASFYIVAFSTLILLIIVASFAAVIISEVTRTSNDDLAQSAYDSALAGVEDAKLAIYNYQRCSENSNQSGNCGLIEQIMENNDGVNCTMVADILGRKTYGTEVIISETTEGDNNMEQAYTCAKFDTTLPDYQGSLSGENQMRVIQAKFSNGVSASQIKKIRISWYEDRDSEEAGYNFNLINGKNVSFPGLGVKNIFVPSPPTISIGMIQTAKNFKTTDFNETVGDTTDRGMIYLVPAEKGKNTAALNTRETDTYISAYNGSGNYVSKTGFLKSNDKRVKNLPYLVGCDRGSFSCSTTIELPEPVGGGERSDDNFVFVVSSPYGKPKTNFVLEFLCNDNVSCSSIEKYIDEEHTEIVTSSVAELDGVQIEVDSTGRANTLYRRVMARLEPSDEFSLSTLGPLEIFGNGDGIKKNFYTICEFEPQFGGPTC